MIHPQSTKALIVIAGPTASGKTAAAIALANHYQTEIISADSRQFYKEMSIGTAKPTGIELNLAKHHFVNSHSITENFNAGDFEKQSLSVLMELFKDHDKVVCAGGSGLFIKALCDGFDEFPEILPEVREKLNAELAAHGIDHLKEKLLAVDPEYYRLADIDNPRRIIRALEVFETTGKTYSSYRRAKSNQRPFNIIKLGLMLPRTELYQRINLRVDEMITNGLVEEAKSLLPFRHLNALNTVGYSELFNYLDGNTDLETAIGLIKQNTRRFAKRQLTWFRKDKDITWLQADEEGLLSKIISVAESPLTD